MPDPTTTPAHEGPAAPTLPPAHASLLQSLHADLQAVIAKAHSIGQTVEGDAAYVAYSVTGALADTEKQLAAFASGAAVPAAAKFRMFVLAQINAYLPAILDSAEKMAQAEVVAVGAKAVAAAGAAL